MSTAELVYTKTKTLSEPAQTVVLHLVELLSTRPVKNSSAAINPGSAKGLVHMAEDFDAPLADFEPYMK